MPSSFAHGYKIPRQGRALFMTYGMDEPVQGNYIIRLDPLVQHERTSRWFTGCCEGGNEGKMHWLVCGEDSLNIQDLPRCKNVYVGQYVQTTLCL